MSQLILANIEKHVQLTEDEKKFFLSLLQTRKIKKKQFFLHEGEISKNSAFVNSGCLRAYFIDPNGFEHILQFAIEDWWIADMMSIKTQTEARLNIDALEDTEVFLLSHDSQLLLLDTYPKFERYFRIITENGLMSYQTRILENLSLTALERYQQFVKRYPAFNRRLPQKQIASFLGMTPEFLSKLKQQILK